MGFQVIEKKDYVKDYVITTNESLSIKGSESPGGTGE
jgi:hypothetical protein